MGCNGCNSSNVPNGCKNNGYCLTQRCNQKTTLDLIANINNSSKKKNNKSVEVSFKNGINILLSSILKTKKNQNQVEIHDKIDRFDNIQI